MPWYNDSILLLLYHRDKVRMKAERFKMFLTPNLDLRCKIKRVFELERARGPVAHILAPGPTVFKFSGPGRPTEKKKCCFKKNSLLPVSSENRRCFLVA